MVILNRKVYKRFKQLTKTTNSIQGLIYDVAHHQHFSCYHLNIGKFPDIAIYIGQSSRQFILFYDNKIILKNGLHNPSSLELDDLSV